MNEDVLKKEINDLFQSAPVLLSTGKKPVSVEAAPAIDLPPQKLEPTAPTAAPTRGNTYSPSAGTVYQDTNTGAASEGLLKQDSRQPYLGATLIPGEEVAAKFRPLDGSAGNPFYLEATQRFVPVKPFSIHLDAINKDFMVETKDPVKIAYDIARFYQGVPEERFFGYRYTPPYMGESFASAASKAGGVAWETTKQLAALARGGVLKLIGNEHIASGSLVDELIRASSEPKKPEAESLVDLVRDPDNYNTLRVLNQKRLEDKIGTVLTTSALGSDRAKKVYDGDNEAIASGVATWNAGEDIQADAKAHKEARMRSDLALVDSSAWTNRLVYTAGEFIPAVAGAAAASWIAGPWAGVAVGGALVGAQSMDNVRRELLSKGYTYDYANKRGYAAGITTGALTAATGAVGGMAGRMAARAWRLGAIGTAASVWAAETATDFAVGVPATLVGSRIENYLAENIGASELLDPVDADELDGAIMSFLLGASLGTVSARRAYVERRSKLKTLKAREEFDNTVAPEFKTVVEVGKEYRKFLEDRFGMSREEADMEMMRLIKDGPEFVEKNIRERYQEIAGKYSLDPESAMRRVEQVTNIRNVENVIASQYKTLDDRISTILDASKGLSDTEKKIYRAVMRSHATEWSLATDMPVGQYPLPEIRAEKLKKGTFGDTTYTPGVQNAPTIIRIDPEQTTGRRFDNRYAEFGPRNETYAGKASTTAHEMMHDLFDIGTKFFKPTEWANYYNRIVAGIQSGYDKVIGLPSAEAAREAHLSGKKQRYVSAKNVNEFAAHAVSVLQKDAKRMFGITDSEAWDAVSQVHSLLSDVNQVVPLTEATQRFIKDFNDLVEKNSESLLRTAERVGADKLKTALEAIADGNENGAAWEGVTYKDIVDFANAINGPLNADAIAAAHQILSDLNVDDLRKATEAMWDEAFAEEAEQIANVGKTTKFTDDIDPIEFLADVLGKKQTSDAPLTQESAETQQALAAVTKAAIDAEEPMSAFERQTTREVDGRTLEQDLDFASSVIGDTKKSRAGAVLSERRGLEGYMFSLGGKKLAKAFDFAVRYQRYSDMFSEKMNTFARSFIDKHLGGSMKEYQKFMRDFETKTIDVTINNPRNDFATETIKVSPSEIANAKFQLDQESNNGPMRVKKTWGDTDVEALYKSLDEKQRAFAESMRDDLAKEAKSELQKLGAEGKIREKYFPFISHEAVADDRPLRSFAFMSRQGSESPVGIVGVSEVFGRYQARLAGARSEYFSSINRLKEMLDYRMPEGAVSTSDEQLMAQGLTDKSNALKKQVIDKIGVEGLSAIMDNIDFVQNGSVVHEIANSPMMKLARNITPKLLGGKLKQIGIGITNMPMWFGAPDVKNTWGYYSNIIHSMAHPFEAKKNALRLGNGFLRHRIENQSFTEFTKRSATPSEDMLLNDAAKFLKKKNLGNLADFTSSVVYLSTLANKVMMLPTTVGDFLGNFIGADALQRTYYKQYIDKGYSPADATRMADNDVVRFVLYRQSSSNQAMKPMTIKRWNQSNAIMASLGQFTGEPTAKGGQIGQNIQGWRMGEISTGDMVKDTAFVLASQIGYFALQAGLLTYELKQLFGKEPTEAEKKLMMDELAVNAVDSMAGLLAGPYSSIMSPFAQTLVSDHNYGLSIPVTSEIAKSIESGKNIGKAVFTEEELEAKDITTILGLGMAASGVFPAFENAYNTARGAYLSASSDEQQATKGRAMLVGRSEKYAEKKAGIKKPRKRKAKSSSNSGIIL